MSQSPWVYLSSVFEFVLSETPTTEEQVRLDRGMASIAEEGWELFSTNIVLLSDSDARVKMYTMIWRKPRS